jgi:uncharacterized protein YndB with AHSA1/START domain
MENPMRLLKAILFALIALILSVVVGGYLLSPKFTVTRSTTISASADKVYALVADPREWKRWSVWNQRDPAMEITYSGPASGVGAAWAWKSKSEGDGKMTLVIAEPARRVGFDLYFPEFDSTSHGELTFAPEVNATKVTWTMHGDMGGNPLARWFTLFMDGMVGKDFEGGLANLKALAEKG